MVKLTLTPYQVPAPLSNARHLARTNLSGWHVRLDQGTQFGLGEAFLWPGFGSSIEQTSVDFKRCHSISPHIETASSMLEWLGKQELIASPVRYAIELACFDLLGKQSSQSVAALLWRTYTEQIPCHTTLKSWAEHDDFTQWADRAVKIKVGLLDPDIEHDRIKAILSAHPAIRLRLDANGSWGLPHARRMCQLAEPYPNVVIEQPLKKEQFKALDELQRNTTTIIALDESFALSPDTALDTECKEIVVKPMYAGGLSISKMRCSQIIKARKRICVTHALEGAVGRAGAQHFAAGINTDGAHGVGHTTNSGYFNLDQSDGHGVVQ